MTYPHPTLKGGESRNGPDPVRCVAIDVRSRQQPVPSARSAPHSRTTVLDDAACGAHSR